MTDAARVLEALGDSSRRRLLDLLRGGERTVRELTEALPVSQSAVSQHLRVLREADLVAVRAEGTRRLYRIDRTGFGCLRAYVDQFWDDVLDAFTAYASDESDQPADQPADQQGDLR